MLINNKIKILFKNFSQKNINKFVYKNFQNQKFHTSINQNSFVTTKQYSWHIKKTHALQKCGPEINCNNTMSPAFTLDEDWFGSIPNYK